MIRDVIDVLQSLKKLDAQGLLDPFLSAFDFAANHTFSGINKYTRLTTSDWTDLTFATTLAVDAAPAVRFTATDNFTLDSVINGGAVGTSGGILMQIKQDPAGSRLLAINATNFVVGDAGLPVLSTAAGAVDWIALQHVDSGKWLVTVVALNVGGT